MNKASFLSKHKSEIYVGIIVFLITSTITAIFNWFKISAPSIGKTALDFLLNIMYTLASQESHSSLIRSIISIAIYSYFAYVLSNCVKSFTLVREVNRGANYEEKEKQSKVSYQSNQKEKFRNNSDLKTRSKKLRNMSILLAFIILIFTLSLYYIYIIPNQVWNKFELDLTMIRPYVDEAEIEHLKSDWVCMRSRDDYLEIYQVINTIKQTNELPK